MDAEQRADDAAQVADMVERRVAAALTGDVLESLSQRIAAEWEHYASGLHVTLGELAGHLERAAVSPWLPLERAPSWWSDLRGHSNTQLALVVADYCLAPRKHGAPSVMHVALEIGRFLGVKGGRGGWGHNPRGATFLAGYRLLELAVEAGFLSAETITTKRSTRKEWDTSRIVLSSATLAALAQLEGRLAAATYLASRPQEREPAPHVIIRRNRRSPSAAPLPIGDEVTEALRAAQGTRWRINRYMLDFLKAEPTDRRTEAAAVVHADYWAQSESGFFLKSNFDFRGRLYNEGRALQFTSATDYTRSLLEFHSPTPFDEGAQVALMNQICDCLREAPPYRRDEDIEARESWFQSALPDLRALVADPRRVWPDVKPKKRYRFLASIEAWIRAERTGECRLPVVLDASCSGLQHAALLLRDETLAKHVNLLPGAKSDFYGLVAGETGYSRDQVKAPVMTTFYGAHVERIAEAIADEEERETTAADIDMARNIQRAAKRLAPNAWELYSWLKRVAGVYSQKGDEAHRRAIEWTLPDGFSVLQDTRIMRGRDVNVMRWRAPPLKPLRKRFKEQFPTAVLDRKRQMRALPPNVIHSFDAAFLRVVVRRCYAGTEFMKFMADPKPRPITSWGLAHDAFAVPASEVADLVATSKMAIYEVYGPDRLAALAGVFGVDGPKHPAVLDARFMESWFTLS
jgi:hypothetical protein